QKAIMYLIQVGALDNFGDRNALSTALPQMYERYKKVQTSMHEGQIDIFSNGDSDDAEKKDIVATPLPPVARASDADKIEWEKNLLGMYITVHPLGKIRAYLDTIGVKKISEVKRMNSGYRVQTCGLITNIKKISTKRENKSMAFLTIEDQSGSIEIVVFPTTYKKSNELLEKNVPTVIVGKVNVRDGERSIICNALKRIDMDTATKTSEGVHLRIPTNANKEAIQKLKEVLKNNPGDVAVTVQIPDGLEVKSMLLKKGIELTDEVKVSIAPFRVD
ncbi:MAG: OB-fold nucleic acid binding domain-containing protein, partial [Patescibacteria group bacterium]|nr:OB-fold nucleic acid binding domain-containing protein [Patescibacteria group bacterium]